MRDAAAPSGRSLAVLQSSRGVTLANGAAAVRRKPTSARCSKELELKIERLKVLYEQYFMGIEKMEPQVARKEVTRTMLTLQQQYIRNTAMRFKFNTMLQKWQLYITYWNRVLREIENGTYVRHLQKAKRKAEKEGRELPAEMRFDKVRPPSGAFSIDEETNKGTPKFLDHDTGQQTAPPPPQVHDDLEEVWDRLVSPAEQKRGSSPLHPSASAPAQPRSSTPPSVPLPGRPSSPPAPPPNPGARRAASDPRPRRATTAARRRHADAHAAATTHARADRSARAAALGDAPQDSLA